MAHILNNPYEVAFDKEPWIKSSKDKAKKN